MLTAAFPLTREQAEAIIDAGVQSFMHWMDQRDPRGGVVGLIRDLNTQAESWRHAEIARRIGHKLHNAASAPWANGILPKTAFALCNAHGKSLTPSSECPTSMPVTVPKCC